MQIPGKASGTNMAYHDNADILMPVLEPYEYSKSEPGIHITL